MEAQGPGKQRFLVVGLDGASFNLIQPWLDRGLLPNFRHLIDGGAHGELESCLPPVTMPAWRVYSTGKLPGQLGVFWHQQLDPDTLDVLTPNATFFQSADFWDYLNAAGIRTGILGMPDTYPPRRVDGFLVAGPPNAGSKDYAYPRELEPVLENLGYRPYLKADFHHASHDGEVVEEGLALIRHTFETATHLLDREAVDFLQVVSFDINRFQHFFYDEEPTQRAWQIADAWLGQVRDRFDYVMVMSDHGTERVRRAFFLNVWLRQNGYLQTRFHPADLLLRLGINRTNVARVAQTLGVTRLFSIETLLRLGAVLPTSAGGFGEFGNQAAVRRVDWQRTRAFALPQGPVYINRRIVRDAGAYEALRDELIARLGELRDPETGDPIMRKVYRREEIYCGPFETRAPDLLAMSDDAYHNRAGLRQADVFARTWSWKGNNRQRGLFILNGPGVQPGIVEGARLVDLAPTILQLYGLAVPEDMDGAALTTALKARPLVEAVAPVSSLAGVDRDQVDGEFDDVVRERLEALGYL